MSNELSAKNIVAIQNIIKNANLVYDLENLSDRIGNIVCKVPVEVIEHKPLKLSPERGIKGEISLADKNCKQLECILQLISMCDNTIVNSQSYDIQFTINNSKHEYSIEPNKYKNMIILTEKNTGIIYYSAIRDYTFGSGYYATIKPPQFGVQSSLNRQLIIDGKSKTVPLTNIAGIGDITVEKEIYEIDKRQNHWRTEYQKQNYYFNAFIKGQEKEAIQTIVNICDDRSLFWDLKKIWLIDPYLSADDILNTVVNCSKYGVEINCLTHLSSIIDNPNTRIDAENGKTRKETIVEKYRTKLKKSIPKDTDFKLEYRNAGGEEGISFHDRYLILEYDINGSRVWSLGISVNSLGTSHHIIQIVESPNDVISTVKEIWNKCDLKENLIFKN